MTIGDLGEFGLIARIAAAFPQGAEVSGSQIVLGIGDDAAVLRAPDRRVVATTDMLIEGRHFRRDWSAPRDIGHKAAARSLSDVAAMGAAHASLLVAFAAPPDLTVAWADEFAAGLAAECARGGAVVAGGDVAKADAITIAVTALGDLEGRAPVTRAGARPGDVVAVAGLLGHSAAGLALLQRGLAHPAELIGDHRRPRPPYEAGPEAAALGATAMIDVSDGLVADLGHLAAASGVIIEVSTARLRIGGLLAEAAEGIKTAAAGETRLRDGSPAAGGTAGPAPVGTTVPVPGGSAGPVSAEVSVAALPLSWVLGGGEDYALAAAFPPATSLPAGWSAIGRVRAQEIGAKAAVLVDGEPYAGIAGWDHFR
ncbi:MAG: thiamine-phosphate kinase [Micromonosporaceae bacterium]